MAKQIPRLDAGSGSVSIPGANPSGATGGAVGVAKALTPLVDTGYKIAADIEQPEAVREQRAMEAKQAVVNEIASHRQVGDFEVDVTGQFEGVKTEFWDQPDKWADQLLDIGRTLLERRTEAAENSSQALEIAREGNTRLMTAVRHARTEALLRQTQKAKNEVAKDVNNFTFLAENSKNGVDGLLNIIENGNTRLYPLLQKALGPAEAETEWAKARAEAVEGYYTVQARLAPEATMLNLEEAKGPHMDWLTADQRKSIRRAADFGRENIFRTEETEAAKAGLIKNTDITRLYKADKFDAGTALALRRETDVALKLAQMPNNPKYVGFEKERVRMVDMLTARRKYIDSMDQLAARRRPPDGPENETVRGELLREKKRVLDKGSGETKNDLLELLKFQAKAAEARTAGDITKKTFDAMNDQAQMRYVRATEQERNNTAWWDDYVPYEWRSPRQTGNYVLDKEFKTFGTGFTEKQKNDIEVEYMRRYNEAETSTGVTPSDSQARKLALQAISLERKIYDPKAWD